MMSVQKVKNKPRLEKIYNIHEENKIRVEPGEVLNDYIGKWFKISNRTNNNYNYTHFRIINNCTVEGYICKPVLFSGDTKPCGYKYKKLKDPFKYFNKNVVEMLYNKEQSKNKTKHRLFLSDESIRYYKLISERNKLVREKRIITNKFNEYVKLWLITNDDEIFETVCDYDEDIIRYNNNIKETTDKINYLVNNFEILKEMYN